MVLEISIHAPREGSHGTVHDGIERICISIHAPREGSDSKNTQKMILNLAQRTKMDESKCVSPKESF